MHTFNLMPLLVLLVLISSSGCKKDPIIITPPQKDNFKYLFLGHTYEGVNTIDRRLEAMNMDTFDQIWLGGDMCSETTADYATLEYMDNLFDLGSPNTHWALGNHDIRNGNIPWITQKTQRPTFYTASMNGICLLVLNTNLQHGGVFDTVQINQQYDLIKAVCDTIQASSHLVVLSHAEMWRYVPQLGHVANAANADFSYGTFRISPDESFTSGIYPLLIQVQNRGIQVINIAGDFGQIETEFEATSPHGIHFLGSGITSDIYWNMQFPSHGAVDKILVLNHNTTTKTISWSFQALP